MTPEKQVRQLKFRGIDAVYNALSNACQAWKTTESSRECLPVHAKKRSVAKAFAVLVTEKPI